MTHAALAPGIGREFDPFLFASVGEGRHGHALSVISALAQSDVDPWLEAVGLARMSRELAAARLSRLIAALPSLAASNRSADVIAEELVALLPQRVNFAPAAPRPTPSAPAPAAPGKGLSANLRLGLGLGAIALMIAISLMFSTHLAPGRALGVSSSVPVEKLSGNSGSGHTDQSR